MNRKYMYGLLLLCVGLLTACGGNKVKDGIQILETIPSSAPKWMDSTQEFWETKGVYYYRGTSEGYANIATAKRVAEAAAAGNMVRQVKNIVRNEFSSALEAGAYEDHTGGYVKDVFFSAVDNLEVSGAKMQDSFLQHIKEVNGLNSKMYYRAYVLVTISKEDYNKMVERAFTDTKKQVAANKSAKELAAQTEERFWKAQEAKAE